MQKFTLFQNFAGICLFLISRRRASHWKNTYFSRKWVRAWMYTLVGSEKGKGVGVGAVLWSFEIFFSIYRNFWKLQGPVQYPTRRFITSSRKVKSEDFILEIFRSLSHLTGISAALLLRRLSNCTVVRQIKQLKLPINRVASILHEILREGLWKAI